MTLMPLCRNIMENVCHCCNKLFNCLLTAIHSIISLHMYVYVVYDLTSCVIVDELVDFIPTLRDAEWGNAWHFLEIPSFGKQLDQMHPFICQQWHNELVSDIYWNIFLTTTLEKKWLMSRWLVQHWSQPACTCWRLGACKMVKHSLYMFFNYSLLRCFN